MIDSSISHTRHSIEPHLIMNSPSLYFTPARYTVLLVIISTCLLLPCCQTVHAINLGKLCAHFGHSCYGGKSPFFSVDLSGGSVHRLILGNWGKRAVPNDISMNAPRVILPKADDEDRTAIDNNGLENLSLEQFRSVRETVNSQGNHKFALLIFVASTPPTVKSLTGQRLRSLVIIHHMVIEEGSHLPVQLYSDDRPISTESPHYHLCSSLE
jgi:hypothetical protein